MFLGKRGIKDSGEVILVLMPGLRGNQMWSRTEGKHDVVKSSAGLLVSRCCSIKSVWMSSVTSHRVHHTLRHASAKATKTSGSTGAKIISQTNVMSLHFLELLMSISTFFGGIISTQFDTSGDK